MPRPAKWHDAVRRRLPTVAEVDAIFVRLEGKQIHVYSVVKEIGDAYADSLLKQEKSIEKSFPKIAIAFHTRAHQGRDPQLAVPHDAELVYRRS